MIQFDSTFSSCQGLQELFQPLSPDLVALQMSRGPLQGRLRIFHLGAIRFNLLETNQSLFLSGTRRPKPCTVAVPLEQTKTSSPYRAQGIPVEWPALMGYNRHLADFDLKLPAGARLATIVIAKEVLLEQLERRGGSKRTLERWEGTNQLELLPDLQQRLQDQLNQLIHRDAQGWNPEDPDQLIDSVIRCFEQPQARTKQIAKREARHEAAIDLLHWCDRNPMKVVTVEALSAELFQSRTSLFKGSKEHFEQTPLELQRSVRMDRVRQLLLNPTRRTNQGLTGVGDTAASMGFTSRSHFARRYQEQYGEHPQDTLANGPKE
ncbi:response regulator transcription factor [Synechococcus sp. NOUM97013]|uniref:helix-turn-helix transcriptional regulator n=1 Tax=Synechococcus sp. NOUM97013 TaxID=1442555 RepID=UPI0016494CD1|nr:response regulator transcription factor [Synechococcus sp. NOUM97013]QNI74855.1 transcriptional regulator/ AraC family protein [Synechococcus sp. NOUM97013]